MASSKIKIVSETVPIDNVFTASGSGDLEKLCKFVEQDGASLSLPDKNGCYALHWAALSNRSQIVQYIIEHGGDVNVVNNYQQTGLHFSAMRGSISVADVLLQNGALIEAADEKGYTAVHVAVQKKQTSFLSHIVTKHNADFDVPDNNGRSPMHWAAYHGFVDIARWLLSKNASHKRRDIKGRTPLHVAAMKGKTEVFTIFIDVGTMQDIMEKDNEGNTATQLAFDSNIFVGAFLLSKVLKAECKHLQNSNFKGKALQTGTNWPMIIAMQGDAYTGKTRLAMNLASNLQCPIISLDDFLVACKPTDEKDTLISNTFNLIAQAVKTQISLGLSVIVDSPLSRLSHLQKLVALVSTKNTLNTRLLIVECKPENKYAYQLRFEESDSVIYASSWYKPAAMWPLPKVLRDYNDEDIPFGVSKLVVDTDDCTSTCKILEAMLDVTSCGYGHITSFNDYWEFIHKDKEKQFRCPHCSEPSSNLDINFHPLRFYERIDHCDRLCGVCDNQICGASYACKDCPLTLHKSCAEQARGDKKHFVPETIPIFMLRDPHVRYAFPIEHPCAECRKEGNSFSSKCKRCLFESHMKSRLVPTVVRHKAHSFILTLWLNLNADGSTCKYMCSACKKFGDYAAYSFNAQKYYHPKCALLPPSVHHRHGGYTHDLEMITRRVEELEDYICDCCSIKMDPSAWYYYCSECIISLHLECAFLDFDSGEPIMEARS